MADEMPPALIRAFALRHEDNVKAMEGYTFAFAGGFGLFCLFHLSRLLYHGLHLNRKGGKGLALLTSPIRFARKFSIHSYPYFPSIGHALTIGAFSALNIIFLFVFINTEVLALESVIASRTGWLAMANLLLSVFLALKNTPLAFLTAWSYERLNILHRSAGLFAVIHVIIHAACYTDYFLKNDRPFMLTSTTSICGIIAGVSFLMLGLGGVFLRSWWYELFYYSHIVFFIIALVAFGMHQPSLASGCLVITILTATIWGLDRLIRISRLLLYSANNKAMLTPLPNGGVRVTMAKNPLGARSGKHCFLWIPAIRTFETHPFTISSMDPLEFVAASHQGFTKELYDYAVANPGAWLKASVDGSYGAFPDVTKYDRVVMIAGGTGASFTFGTALNALKKLKENSKTRLVFVWAVRDRSFLNWYANHIWTLKQDSRVSVHIFVTKSSRMQAGEISEKQPVRITTTTRNIDSTATNSSASSFSEEVERGDSLARKEAESDHDLNSFAGVPISWARPNASGIIRDIVSDTPRDEKVLVLGCGPNKMMKTVRNTTAECIKMTGPTVELHCEEFGW